MDHPSERKTNLQDQKVDKPLSLVNLVPLASSWSQQNHHGYKVRIAQPESCKLMNPSSTMSSMEEPLLPLVHRDQKYSPSKQDGSKSCDVPNRSETSFHPESNVKGNSSDPSHPPATRENTNIVSTPPLQRVRSSPSVFTSTKEAPCAYELDEQSRALKGRS